MALSITWPTKISLQLVPPQAIVCGFCDTWALQPHYCCRQAHAIVVTFAVNQTETLNHVGEVWMPRLQQLRVTVPVILAGLKCDILREEDHLHQVWGNSARTPLGTVNIWVGPAWCVQLNCGCTQPV